MVAKAGGLQIEGVNGEAVADCLQISLCGTTPDLEPGLGTSPEETEKAWKKHKAKIGPPVTWSVACVTWLLPGADYLLLPGSDHGNILYLIKYLEQSCASISPGLFSLCYPSKPVTRN